MYERTRIQKIGSAFGSLYRSIDAARRVILNLIFLALVIALVAWWMSDDGPEVPEQTALVLSPRGVIVEQLAGDAVDRAVGKLTGDEEPETLYSDLVRAIRAAKDDDRVKVLLLDLSQMGGGGLGGGLSKLQDLRVEIDKFKESGKPVIATADFYGKSQYFLATAADEIYVHHMGMVFLDGYSRFRRYHKDGLDRAEIDWNIFRVGTFKSAVEPFMRNDMSDKARESNLEWLGDMWGSYLEDVAAARNLTPDELSQAIEDFTQHLEAAGGQGSEMALQLGLVDFVGDRDLVRGRLIELVGEDEDTHSFHQIRHGTYLETVDDDPNEGKGDDTVAVIVARGQILNGSQSPGTIGGDSTAALIRKARNDEDVKAIVLRVDSPGGSAFASELIRREFVLAREAGKKVVVSMATVAASGGYWISTASDEIWASPNTITGSIGIFGMLPTFQKPLATHLGTRVEGVGTTWLGGAARPDRELDPRVGEAIQTMIEQGYQDFLERVGEARDMTTAEVDEIGQGRVWSGADAHELGLVDQLGGLEDAIASAATMAELGDDYRVEYVEKSLDFKDQMLVDMLSWTTTWYKPETRRLVRPQLEKLVVDYISSTAETLIQLNDPRGMYAHCMCEVE
ncbi:MAG: signal peptide peptidase SppA [bacterium]|nr:signal peptide peptidase SppA [bacterium]